ncbi:MAG: glycoside hydrolase family 38 C-terminal domain-containing protein [Candidatus Sulfotelmatobacter sp.]
MSLYTVLLGLLLTTGPQPHSLGQQLQNQIVIRVNEAASTASTPASSLASYLNGYRSSINGQTIEYHSSDPDADSALLVRGQSIAHSISWETDPMPAVSSGHSQFIWLAGIERAGFEGEKDSHSFDFLINGQPWFTFKNAKGSTATSWKIEGKDGAELSFASVMTDRVGDLFGYMLLKVPGKDFDAGKPLTLEVDGDNSGSADWYMTFQHRFNFVPQVRAEPALIRDGAQVSQVLRLSLDNLADGRTLEVHAPNHAPISAVLKIGANIFRLPIPATDSEATWPVRFEINGKLVETSAVHVTPVKKRDIYLLSYSHNDIGYTDLQPDVERKQWNNLDQAMRLIRETRDYPADARYKWNLETIWALESYLKRASPAQREEFLADVRQGSIGLSALYANMLTGLANSVEMSHFYDFARRLRTDYHIPMTTAVTSDVPGFNWGVVAAMAQSGVKYFATAPNEADRIGYTLQTWGDKPFYWASQSGQEKVLTWMAGASYSSFHEGPLSKLGDEKIMKLVRKLDEASYPYEMVQLPYTLSDNGPPDPTLSDFVRQWNERYVTPRLIVATHEQMFQEFEKRYGATLPVVQGDFTPYWEDGAASTAYETALNRAAADRLIQGQVLWAMLSPGPYPAQEYESAWRNVVFYDEHTWGAHNSIEEPDLPFVKQQWEIKRRFAVDADRDSRALLAKAVHSTADLARNKPPVDVYNTDSWPRTDIVFLAPELSAAGDHVVDADGRALRSQRLSTGELAVLVENISPFSAKRLFVEKGEAYSKSGAEVRENTLENDFLVLSVNPQTGSIASLKWKTNGVELVDGTRGAGLNQYLYVLGTDPAKAQPVSNVRVRVKEQGNLVVSLLVETDAPGAKRYSSEIRLVEGIDRMDLITNLDKSSVREKEGVHIAFPFAVPDAQLRYDVADGVVRPEADQLAGACKNFFSVQSWVDVSNRDYGVTWATPNAPLVEIGSITAEQPWLKSIQLSSLIYSYVMNNYWHTNYKADQEGPVTFSYSLLPHAAFTVTDAVKFGVERRQPLIVAVADPSTKPRSPVLLLSSPDVIVSSLKPMASGSWLIYLYNPTGKTQRISFHWADGDPVPSRPSDAGGQAGDQTRDFEVAAFDSAYRRIDQAAPDNPGHQEKAHSAAPE